MDFIKKNRIAWNKGLKGEEYTKHYSNGFGMNNKGKKFPKELYPNFGNRNKKMSEETKKKMRQNHRDNSGKRNPMYGKPSWNKGVTKETDNRIKRGDFSKEHKRKIGEAHKGKKHSKEQIKKLSQTRKRKFASGELINPMLGKKRPDFSKFCRERKGRNYEELYGKEKAEKMKKRLRELKQSEERNKKRSESMKRWHKEIGFSKETRKKISERTKGENNPMYGKKWIDRPSPFKNTKVELKIQNFLSLLHIEYLTHKYISEITHGYQCDILIPKQETDGIIIPQKTIIECDGCFWHGCNLCNKNKGKELKEFQLKSIERDDIRTRELMGRGYRVTRLWEHEIKVMKLNDLKDKLPNPQNFPLYL